MSHDPNAEFDAAVLDKIELSPVGALPATPAYQDALRRLYAAQQVYAHADHKDGHVTARSLGRLPSFHAGNLDAFIAGQIPEEALEPNATIYARYVQSLPAALRSKAESLRLMVIGKPTLHRAHHGVVVHDPLHMLFLAPGAGPNPGLPGNYLHGALFHVGPDAASGTWEIHLHDSDDGVAVFGTPARADALAKLQEVLASAPFHLNELPALGFTLK
jgi:hypothetical protein